MASLRRDARERKHAGSVSGIAARHGDGQGGVVTQVQHWVCWNGQNWPTITIRREQDGTFFSNIGDPEHGSGTARGTLVEVIEGLHPDVQKPYIAAFGAARPT